MSEPTRYLLEVKQVEGFSAKKNTRLYVEISLDNVRRKTGNLNEDGKPGWRGTLSFSHANTSALFNVFLKTSGRFTADVFVGHVAIKIADLLAKSTSGCAKENLDSTVLPRQFFRVSTVPSITVHLCLKSTEALKQAETEVEMAIKSVEQIKSRADQRLYRIDAIGFFVEALNGTLEAAGEVAPIPSVLKLSTSATSTLLKLVSDQFEKDKELVVLVERMSAAFDFAKFEMELPKNTELLKKTVTDMLNKAVECSLFVQRYASRPFFSRMLRRPSARKVTDFSTRFEHLRRDLDTAINQQIQKEAKEIHANVQETKVMLVDAASQKRFDGLKDTLEPFTITCNVGDHARCHPKTRTKYLERIRNFLKSETSPNILWLTGPAGYGKSTIVVTASDEYGDNAVHLFFDRGKSEPGNVIRTIAYKLAERYPLVRPHIIEAVAEKKNISDGGLKKQFDELLSGPLSAASVTGPIVIILDALDECGNADNRRDLLRLLKTGCTKLPSNVRILITSRPEPDITKNFATKTDIDRVELEHSSEDSRSDVGLYIRNEMMEEFDGKVKVLEKEIQMLCDAADGHFIWASTALKLVRNDPNPSRKLKNLANEKWSLQDDKMDSLYATVLEESGIWSINSSSKDDGTVVLGLVLVGKEAMISADIEAFLGLEEGMADRILRRLRSVVLYEAGKPVRLHHASFADYLLSAKRSGSKAWHIDESKQKQAVTDRCFDVMAKKLHFNICKIESSFFCNECVPDLQTRIAKNIRPHLGYACRFWAVHLGELSKPEVSNGLKDRMKKFGKEHLLYWFEVLSLTGEYNRVAVRALFDTSLWSALIDNKISSLFWEAYRLASVFAYPISQSAPHIYLSAISLWKGESSIADHYSETHPCIKVCRLGTRTPARCMKVLGGHTWYILSMATSPDGRFIASGSADKTIRVWSAFSGEQISHFGEDNEVWSVAFSPDSKSVVSGCKDGTIRIWDVDLGQPVSGLFKTGNSWDISVAFSVDGERVISVADKKVHVFDSNSGKLVSVQFEDDKDVVFYNVTPDGKYVLGYKVRTGMNSIWDAGTGKRVSAPIEGEIAHVSLDGERVVTVNNDAFSVWNVSGELVTGPFKAKEHSSLWPVAISQDGKRVISGGKDDTIAVWDVDNGQRIWGECTSRIRSVIFTPDGKRVISGSDDYIIRIWDVEGGTGIVSSDFEAHTDYVRSIVFSADGKCIVLESDDDTTRIWDVDTGKHLSGPFEGHTGSVLPDGKRVVSGSEDGTIRIWDVDSGKLIMGLPEGHASRVGSIAVSTDGKRIVSSSWEMTDITLCVWSADNGELLWGPLRAHPCAVYSLVFSLDSRHIVSGACDGTVCIWDADSGELVFGPFEGQPVDSVVFHPDGKHIVSSSGDEIIRIWDVDSGECVSRQVKAYTQDVFSVALSLDGKLVVYGYGDGAVRICDVNSGDLVCGPLEGHTGPVQSVMISLDGNRVVSSSEDEIIRVWDVSTVNTALSIGLPAVSVSSGPSMSQNADSDVVHYNHNTSTERAISNWILSDDGWVRSEWGELLIWIPEDMRVTLWRPRNTAVSNCQFSTRLDFKNSPMGENWSEGYPRKRHPVR